MPHIMGSKNVDPEEGNPYIIIRMTLVASLVRARYEVDSPAVVCFDTRPNKRSF